MPSWGSSAVNSKSTSFCGAKPHPCSAVAAQDIRNFPCKQMHSLPLDTRCPWQDDVVKDALPGHLSRPHLGLHVCGGAAGRDNEEQQRSVRMTRTRNPRPCVTK